MWTPGGSLGCRGRSASVSARATRGTSASSCVSISSALPGAGSSKLQAVANVGRIRLVARPPLLAGHDRGVDVGRLRSEGSNRGRMAGDELKRIPSAEPAGVLPTDLIDQLVGTARTLALGQHASGASGQSESECG